MNIYNKIVLSLLFFASIRVSASSGAGPAGGVPMIGRVVRENGVVSVIPFQVPFPLIASGNEQPPKPHETVVSSANEGTWADSGERGVKRSAATQISNAVISVLSSDDSDVEKEPVCLNNLPRYEPSRVARKRSKRVAFSGDVTAMRYDGDQSVDNDVVYEMTVLRDEPGNRPKASGRRLAGPFIKEALGYRRLFLDYYIYLVARLDTNRKAEDIFGDIEKTKNRIGDLNINIGNLEAPELTREDAERLKTEIDYVAKKLVPVPYEHTAAVEKIKENLSRLALEDRNYVNNNSRNPGVLGDSDDDVVCLDKPITGLYPGVMSAFPHSAVQDVVPLGPAPSFGITHSTLQPGLPVLKPIASELINDALTYKKIAY